MHLHGYFQEDGHKYDDQHKSDHKTDEKRAQKHPSEVHGLSGSTVSDG